MIKSNKGSRYFGARRNYWIIGTLVVIIGVILLGVGFNMVKLGEKVKSRYETIGGTVLRTLSPEDQKNYEEAKDSIVLGEFLEVISIVLIIIGLIIIIKPELSSSQRNIIKNLK